MLSSSACERLVRKSLAVDRLTARAVAAGEVTSLAHEIGDDAVKAAPLEVQRPSLASHPLLTRAECTEVLSSLGNHCAKITSTPDSRQRDKAAVMSAGRY